MADSCIDVHICCSLHMQVCADTVVGGGLLRGVSGGQRKRVTTGELMVGPAKTLLMDEISTGLDSSTTYLIVRCIRNYVHLLEVSHTALWDCDAMGCLLHAATCIPRLLSYVLLTFALCCVAALSSVELPAAVTPHHLVHCCALLLCCNRALC
jgi:hypothetical protein